MRRVMATTFGVAAMFLGLACGGVEIDDAVPGVRGKADTASTLASDPDAFDAFVHGLASSAEVFQAKNDMVVIQFQADSGELDEPLFWADLDQDLAYQMQTYESPERRNPTDYEATIRGAGYLPNQGHDEQTYEQNHRLLVRNGDSMTMGYRGQDGVKLEKVSEDKGEKILAALTFRPLPQDHWVLYLLYFEEEWADQDLEDRRCFYVGVRRWADEDAEHSLVAYVGTPGAMELVEVVNQDRTFKGHTIETEAGTFQDHDVHGSEMNSSGKYSFVESISGDRGKIYDDMYRVDNGGGSAEVGHEKLLDSLGIEGREPDEEPVLPEIPFEED